MTNDTFNFWFPVEVIEKAGKIGTDGAKMPMRIKGIASTDAIDTDGEILLNDGFDVSYLLKRGFINWHHQYKSDPSAIIGEPDMATVTEKGLYIEATLYDTPVAREAYNLAKVLAKNSKTRRLGWSIEGRAIERDGNVIKKARVVGIALTPQPKNRNTFAEICKAMVDGSTTEKILEKSEKQNFNDEEDFDFVFGLPDGSKITIDKERRVKFIQKAMEAGGVGKVLSRESLEGGLKISKPKLILRIMKKYPELNFKKAVEVQERVLKNLLKNKRNKN